MPKAASRRGKARGAHAYGFTLVEVVVALAIGVLVLTGAWTLVVSVSDAAEQVIRESEAVDREANEVKLVRDLVRSAEVDHRSNLVFIGGPDSASFASWCDVPQGWSERCSVTLFPTRAANGTAFQLRASNGLNMMMRGRASIGGLIYLDQSVEPREWRLQWNSSTALPSAIGVIGLRDTLLLVIGE